MADLEDRVAELEEENRQLENRAEAAEQKVQDLTSALDEIQGLAKQALR